MRNKKLLVTGGAGYIGSHVVRQLGAGGEDVITLDNLCTGFREAVTSGELIIGETGDASGDVVSITCSDLAQWAGTIPYEILTNINTRVPRLYLNDNG